MLGFNVVLHTYTHELLPWIWNIDHGAGTCTLNSYWCITIVRNHAGYMSTPEQKSGWSTAMSQ